MKILLLGVGLQGKAALHDLIKNKEIDEIIAADSNIDMLKKYVEEKKYPDVVCEFLDANKQEDLDNLFKCKPDIVIDLLPYYYRDKIVETAVKNGVSIVNTMYTSPKIRDLGNIAKKKNITILPEFGFDPGIDLVLLGKAIKDFNKIEVINSYGAGIPEIEAANNPLKYKVTWSLEGVLRSYYRAGKLIKNGKLIEFSPYEMYDSNLVHEVNVEGVGKLEAIPNGDAIKYLEFISIQRNSKEYQMIKEMGRYSMRWPGHCEFWRKMVNLHFLDEEPIIYNNITIDRRKLIAKILEPHIQFNRNEKDIAIILLEVIGYKDDKKTRVIYQMIDRRDLETGFFAMNRTVGYTASIGAQLILSGAITKKGLLSPVTDVPYSIFFSELKKRGIEISSREQII